MSEQLPESPVILQDTTKDGLLTITVWRDVGIQTDLMRESGIEAMGILRIYNNMSFAVEYEERVPLSHNSVYGPGPTVEETDYWSGLVDQLYTGSD